MRPILTIGSRLFIAVLLMALSLIRPMAASAAPSVAGFSPTSGAVGTSVTIGGTELSGTTAVAFNGVNAPNFSISTNGYITVPVPAGATTGPISVVTSTGNASSTSNFTVVTSALPTVSGFSPSSGAPGASVTIGGANLSTATLVKFNGVAVTSFSINSSGYITTTVPSTATTGPISVTTPAGTATSTTNFEVLPPAPTVSGFSPTSGAVGATVTIGGTNLATATSVKFGTVAATSITVLTGGYLSVTVPSGATTAAISVTTPGGTATSSTTFTVVGPPTVTGFTPTSGAVGASVTIAGTNLYGVTAVKFNGVAATTFSATSSTSITATVPTGATTGPVSVTTPGGTATTTSSFTVSDLHPVVSGFGPSTGPVGTWVTIGGTNLSTATAVKFNGVTAPGFSVLSGGYLTVPVPQGATTGPISVTTPVGTATSTNNFTVTTTAIAPTVSGFTPSSGAVGTTVTVTGQYLNSATAVKFNGVSAANFSIVTGGYISVAVPTGATTGPISVTTPGGTATSSASFTVTSSTLPTVSGFSPTSGPVGTTVTIGGTNLSTATSVHFGSVAASGITVLTGGYLSVVVPTGATTGKISVTSPAGTATSASDFTVTTTTSLPTVTGFTPTSGGVGTVVTIAGTNLAGATAVKFNGVAATAYTVASATSITASVPTGATTGVISVTTAAGTASSANAFTVVPSPTITSFSPSKGQPGTVVTITGTNLTGASIVAFGSLTSTFTVVSATQIRAVVPASAATCSITVKTPGGYATTSAQFVVAPYPVITGFSPTAGLPGTLVTITGTGFVPGTTVRFHGASADIVTVVSSTQMTAYVPALASTGPVAAYSSGGVAVSNALFTVPAGIQSITPEVGAVNTAVAIHGFGFTGATAVRFNETSATFTVASDTLINAVAPQGMDGFVSVTTTAGNVYSPVPFFYHPAYVVASPPSGKAGGVIALSLSGNINLAMGLNLQVSFNGAPAEIVNNDPVGHVVYVRVPTGATTGVITLTTPGGTVASTATFTVTQ